MVEINHLRPGLPITLLEVDVRSIVAAARELSAMDLAFTSRLTTADQLIETVDGRPAFGIRPGASFPAARSLCRRVIDGELPAVIADLAANPVAAAIPGLLAAGVRAAVSVPIRTPTGGVHGSLCCVSAEVLPDLGERQRRTLEILSRMITDRLEHDRRVGEELRARAAEAGLQALAAATRARDAYTAEHSETVLDLVAAIARRMGLDDAAIATTRQVALLHDLGKLGVPDAILRKPGPLDEAEWEVMRTHPAVGAALVAVVPELAHLAPAIRAEHERWDGGGYPAGLRGLDIPVASRIVLVCDAYSAMTSDRPYRRALPADAALAEIRRHSGTQFCPTAAAALIAELTWTA